MNSHSTVSSLPATPNGKATRCPETGCRESFDDSSLVFLHFVTSHPFSYIRLKKLGADALCDVVPGADKSCVVRRMRVVVDDAGGGKDLSERIAATKNVDGCGDAAANGDEDDESIDEVSIVDEEIDLEIVKAYESLTMDGRRRQSVDMEDVSQCSERENATTCCLSPSPKIDRYCPKLVSSTPLNVVVGEAVNRQSPSPNDEIATAIVATANGSKKLDEKNIDDDVHDDNENEEEEKNSSNIINIKDNRSLEHAESSHKRRRSHSGKRNRSRSKTNSSTRSLSPQQEPRRQRSRSASAPPKRRRRSASRSSRTSKSSGGRRSSSSSHARKRSSRSASSNNVKRRRRRSPSSSSRSSGGGRSSSRRSGSASPSRRRRTRRSSMRSSNCSSEELSIPCLICAKTFPSPDEAYNHDIDTHVSFGRFPCILCKKFVASDSNKLQSHIENQHPARRRILKLPCPFCRQNFDLWHNYNSHLEWDYSARRRRVYEEIWHRSSLQCSLCGAETGAVDRRDFENHARDCRALKDNGGGRKDQPQPCCTRRHAERRGCIHFRTFCKKYPGCSGAVCDFAHPTCKFDAKCRTNNCEWYHTAAPRERCSMCGKNASSSSHDQSF